MADLPQFLPGSEALAEDLNAIVDAVNALQDDSGWQNVSWIAPYGPNAYGSPPTQIRKIGKIVYFRGWGGGGQSTSPGSPCFQLPDGWRPMGLTQFLSACGAYGENIGFLQFGADGLVQPYPQSGSNGDRVYLDSFQTAGSFPVGP